MGQNGVGLCHSCYAANVAMPHVNSSSRVRVCSECGKCDFNEFIFSVFLP